MKLNPHPPKKKKKTRRSDLRVWDGWCCVVDANLPIQTHPLPIFPSEATHCPTHPSNHSQKKKKKKRKRKIETTARERSAWKWCVGVGVGVGVELMRWCRIRRVCGHGRELMVRKKIWRDEKIWGNWSVFEKKERKRLTEAWERKE